MNQYFAIYTQPNIENNWNIKINLIYANLRKLVCFEIIRIPGIENSNNKISINTGFVNIYSKTL